MYIGGGMLHKHPFNTNNAYAAIAPHGDINKRTSDPALRTVQPHLPPDFSLAPDSFSPSSAGGGQRGGGGGARSIISQQTLAPATEETENAQK